ncbi:unnamed protein product [Cuscuta campestris]|uniref:DUF4283 domain-containing protein n=1 Tax=Cuscuta campestris TaxID=132261 RepID=A0A484M7Z7_9ASTE|nr:unnamed protein product [Cuscuta campestris]
MGKRGRPPKNDGKAQNESNADDIYTEKWEEKVAYQTSPNGEDDEGKNEVEETLMLESTTTKVPEMEKAKSYADVVGIQEDLKLDLKFIPAEIIEGNPVAKLTMEDVIEPGIYWESALVYCVLGANPPLEVIKGFLHRIWKSYDIDDISFLKESQFIVRLKRVEDRNEIIKRKYYFMDNKPVYVQEWYPGCKVNIMERKDIPIWVQFPDLEMKYWSLTGLSRLGSTIGQPVRRDGATASRKKWAYARIQVEVQINQKFPDQINFINEDGRVITQNVIYEWTPTICSHYNRIGHVMEKCRKKSETKGEHINRRKMAWRPKVIPQKNDAIHEEEPISEEENKKADHDSTPINKETKNTEELENNEGFTEVHKKKAARRVSLEGDSQISMGCYTEISA